MELKLIELQSLGLYVVDGGGGQCSRQSLLIERRPARALIQIDQHVLTLAVG